MRSPEASALLQASFAIDNEDVRPTTDDDRRRRVVLVPRGRHRPAAIRAERVRLRPIAVQAASAGRADADALPIIEGAAAGDQGSFSARHPDLLACGRFVPSARSAL